MPRFHARYIARNGRRGTVRLDAIDLASLSEHIESSRKGYIVEIRRVTGRSGASARVRIASSMLLAALDSLELMLVSGVRINTALRTLAECAPPGNARRLWTEAVRLIEESGSFGESLRQFTTLLNEPRVGVITAHETAGRLADGVRHVHDYVAQMQEIRRESVRGLAYPALVSVAGLASSLVLCVFTLPRFSRMLRDIGVTKTNRITGFFFGLSDFVVRHPDAPSSDRAEGRRGPLNGADLRHVPSAERIGHPGRRSAGILRRCGGKRRLLARHQPSHWGRAGERDRGRRI